MAWLDLSGNALPTLPELPNHYRGKVRDNYDLPDGRRILITSDRISAFDRALAAIPFKGQVLTQTARYWFERTADICPNHVLAYPDPNVVVGLDTDHFFIGVGDNDTPRPISEIFENVPFFRQTTAATFEVAWYYQMQLLSDNVCAGGKVTDVAES